MCKSLQNIPCFWCHVSRLLSQPVLNDLQVLRQLQDLVQIQIGSMQQISLLRGITEHLTSKATVPFANQQAASLYTIEMLDFRIG